MVSNKSIHIILTGGTIDSLWNGSKDAAIVAEHSVVPAYFQRLGRNLKFGVELEFTEVCMKDSREINEVDRKNVVEAIRKSDTTRIIVTHGTYTMPETARYIKSNLRKQNKKTIVITGSMVPIDGFDFSDAPFNLGYAYSEVIKQKPGVYVCMSGMTFSPEEVAKNTDEGKFYSLFNDKQ